MASELDALLGVATPDVAGAVAWLLSEGAVVTEKEDPHGMGFALVQFAFDDGAEVRMVRDRGQWMMDLRSSGQPWLQFDLVHRITSNYEPDAETENGRRRYGGDMPPQLPVGVSWREHLPSALIWLHRTADAADQVKQMARVRMREVFPQSRQGRP